LSSSLEIPHPSFGEAARFLRVNVKMTQEQVADRSGLHVTQISELEQGRGNPTRKTIDSLAKGLDVPPAYILTLEDIFERKRNRLKGD
jgi:transcriptional regulator with XRE-family HTH domain